MLLDGSSRQMCDVPFVVRDVGAGNKECALDAPDWPKHHAKYEAELFRVGMQAVKMSLENTRRIHAPERAVGLRMMSAMGFFVKSWNFLTKGKFAF